MKFEWEIIDISDDEGDTRNRFEDTLRAKVRGGWIILNRIENTDIKKNINKSSTSMVFIPDAEHKWEIDKD